MKNKQKYQKTKEDAILSYYSAQLRSTIELHTVIFDEIFKNKQLPSKEIAEIFEDIANIYLFYSEKISLLHIRCLSVDASHLSDDLLE
jgi:hypothetical protein